MAKNKTTKTTRSSPDLRWLLAPFIALSLCIYMHNRVISMLYVLTVIYYFALQIRQNKKGLLWKNGFHAFTTLPAYSLTFFLPILVPLYYFSFTVSLLAFSIGAISTYLIYKEGVLKW